MPAPTERVPAPLLVLTAIISVQVGSSLAKQLFDDLGAAGVTLLRLGLAALFLLVLLRPGVRRWTRASWTAALLLGAAMAGMNLVFYLSLRTVPLGVAVTVEFLGPLLLALVQTRRAVDLLWAALAAGGVLLLGLDSSGSAPLSGLLLAFVAGLFWAAYIVASARVGQVLPRCSCCRSASPGQPRSSSVPCCCWPRSGWRCSRASSRTGWSWPRCGASRRRCSGSS